MPILKTVLDEELLTKQERNVLRHLYRLAQIGQGLIECERLMEIIEQQKSFKGNTVIDASNQVAAYREYLFLLLGQALHSYRVPVVKAVGDEPSNPGQQTASK